MKTGKNVLARLWRVRAIALPVLKAQRGALIFTLFLSLLLTVFELLRPQPIRILFDAFLIPNAKQLPSYLLPMMEWDPVKLISVIAGAVLAISIGIGLTNYFMEIRVAYLGNKVIARLRKAVFRHLIVLPNLFHDSQRTGDLVLRITGDILMMRDLFVTFLISFVGRVILLIGMIVVMSLMNWRLTLFVAAFLPLLFWLTIRTSARVGVLTRKQREQESLVAHSVQEIIGEMRTFAAYGKSDIEDDKFDDTSRRSFKGDVKSRKERARLTGITETTLGIGLCAIIGFGSYQIVRDDMSAGELLVFISYMRTMFKPVRSITALVARTGKAVACSERVLEILETPVTIEDAPDAIKPPRFEGLIEWRDVELTYGGKGRALTNINITIEPNSIVGLSGPSGSGKSSLCMLVPRIYDPDSGEVLIDGIDIRKMKLESLRSQVSLVLQDSGIFDLTIAENVAFGLPESSREDIERACREAGLHKQIMAMKSGYDTPVGERGVFLSGGQRQRLALARAILRDPRILILDEPFEGLDASRAEGIRKTILSIGRKRTVLIVSHHEEHLEGCTHRLEMKDGSVVNYSRSAPIPAEVS